MYKKILSEKDTQSLKVGDILYKYPVGTESMANLDVSDPRKFLRYEIYTINGDMVDLIIPEIDIPNPSVILGIGIVSGTLDNPPVLHKSFTEFRNEKIWWYN